jgi:hypothetical protein
MWVGRKVGIASKGMIITYNRFDEIYFTPKEQDLFLEELQKINKSLNNFSNTAKTVSKAVAGYFAFDQLKNFGVKAAHKPSTTLRTLLTRIKDRREVDESTGVVYQISCGGCNAQYIGETGRELGRRVEEHQRAIRNRQQSSHLYRHIQDTQHTIDWPNTKILAFQRNLYPRRIVEACFRSNNPNAINRSLDLPVQYVPFVSDILN